jgi:hypothetical protein
MLIVFLSRPEPCRDAHSARSFPSRGSSLPLPFNDFASMDSDGVDASIGGNPLSRKCSDQPDRSRERPVLVYPQISFLEGGQSWLYQRSLKRSIHRSGSRAATTGLCGKLFLEFTDALP